MLNPLLDSSELPHFDAIRPQHAVPALEELIAAHRQKLAALLDDPAARDFPSLITPLEEMSHELGRVWSPIGHLQSVLDDPEWRVAYNASLPLMTEHGTELSQNKRLYDAYQAVADSMPADATPQMQKLVEQELRDFRLSGVALPEKEKDRYREIMQELAALQAAFDQNVQDATDNWHFQTADESDVAGIPESVLKRARQDAADEGSEGWLFKLDYPNHHAIMTHCDARHVRETFYRAWSTRASEQGSDPKWDNSRNIERILALRHEAARMVGFDNYADYSLATKMAGTVDEVVSFLTELADKSKATAKKELADVQAIANAKLEAWDTTYYLEKLKQQRFSISDEELRQYFPFTVVKKGMFDVAERLYGITVVENADVSCWHDTVRYFEIRDSDEKLIGSFYTDLFARKGKRGGAWMDECVVRKQLSGKKTPPVGYLVCNFPPPDGEGLSLLTHNDVVTLFHEFGHMLHHLLTVIDYPSIAGINGVPWDAVELPSQFMENFAWSYDVLQKASSHYQSGDPLPRAVFDKLDASRHFGEALAMLRQVELALFDFRLHAAYDEAAGGQVLEMLAQVRRDVAIIEHPAYNRLPCSFSHIFAGGYAAGYYSYKWAEVLAADAFAAFEEAGIFDADTALRFRREILEIGGSRDFMDAYVAFRGRKPTLDALLRQSGIGKAA
ncbi:MAG: M3 family metallopeptidase [Gammaproteobacteria bacterium]|nr:M3 family metallopeptidase [Gammaproteobacteria bacterium]